MLAMRDRIIVDTLKFILMYGYPNEAKMSIKIELRQRNDDMLPKPTEKSILVSELMHNMSYLLPEIIISLIVVFFL